MTISVPPFYNVPDVGDAILSPWYQQITRWVAPGAPSGVVQKAGDSMTGALNITVGGTGLTLTGSAVIGGQVNADIAALGLTTVGSTPAPLRLYGPVGACYHSYYAEGNTSTRSAYVGYGHNSVSFYLNNERAAGSLIQCTENAHIWQTATTPTNAALMERMRLTQPGDLLIGKTTAGALNNGVEARNTGMVYSYTDILNSPNVWCTRAGAASANDQTFVTFRNGTTQIGRISMYGETAVAYQQTSDYRLKDDLGPITGAADRLNLLQPKRIRWKATGTEMDGFLAHEVTPAVPEAVTGAKDAVTPTPPDITRPIVDENGDPTGETETVPDPLYPPADQIQAQQLDSSQLIPLLVAALQEALDRIAVLEAAA